MSKKPQGLPEFQSLLSKLAQVPKKELDKQLANRKPKRKKKATKRKK